jgi:calcineurin-like phosphoesterase family protein
MSKTWFTADTHLGHANIIKHCSRPFSTVEEMDASLIATWNAVVRPDDDIWHLGDFSYRSAKAPADYLRRLSGRKHLVSGNHDTEQSRNAPGWASSQAYAEITVDGTPVVLFH